MPSLDRSTLASKLRGALPSGTRFISAPDEISPAEVEIPDFGKAFIYLWTLTPDRSARGRPPGEYKIQLIVSGHARGKSASFKSAKDFFTAVLGYSPDFGVFCGWQADLYPKFAWSRNVQVREHLLVEARRTGWAVDEPRTLKTGDEVRVAFSPGHLMSYLRLSRDADRRRLCGEDREVFLLNTRRAPVSTTGAAGAAAVVRGRILAERLVRDAKFGPAVKAAYGFGCAVCAAQLDIIEGAHIIPASEDDGEDEVWNGIALCPNHHTLFDSRLLVVREDLSIGVDDPVLEFLRDEGRDAGAKNLLLAFKGKRIAKPSFWTDKAPREKMQRALKRRRELSGGS